MKRAYILSAVFLSIVFLFAACAQKSDNAITPVQSETASASGTAGGQDAVNMPARPGSGVTGDASANVPQLVDVSGTVKEVNGDLMLITCEDGSDFMLRFGEHTEWAQGVSKDINAGDFIACTVKPEPTFTTPAQGEVYEVTQHAAAGSE
jgi:hypothetical protein